MTASPRSTGSWVHGVEGNPLALWADKLGVRLISSEADRLIIDSPSSTGLIVLKALAPEPGLMSQAQASLAASSCKVQTEAPGKPTPQARR